MATAQDNSANVLCYDIIAHLFDIIYATEYNKFKAANSPEKNIILYMNNEYTGAGRTCRLWAAAYRAAKLTGFYYDFPIIKRVGDQGLRMDMLNKYPISIYNNVNGSLLGLSIYVGMIRGVHCYAKVIPMPLIHVAGMYICGQTYWTGINKIDMSVSDYVAVCRRLGAVFGDKSYIATRLMYWPDNHAVLYHDYIIFENELRTWLRGVKVAREAYKIEA
jgi:hypothetical protein